MLPGGGYNSLGFRDDPRGYRKKNSFLKLFNQYAPVVVILELLLLVIVVVVMQSNLNHNHTVIERYKASAAKQASESSGLMQSLQQERQSRTSTERVLAEVNQKHADSMREVETLRSSTSQYTEHCNNLQESYDRTRISLEAERDAAQREINSLRADLTAANTRVQQLLDQLTSKERELNEVAHRNLAEHSAKDAQLAQKDVEWQAMRKALEDHLNDGKAGGAMPTPPPLSQSVPQAHPDYAAASGAGVYHPTHDGKKERFIDTAEALERDGVVDPAGRSHLAAMLGHLYDMKMAEIQADEAAHPGVYNSAGRPAIGDWMGKSLMAMGVTYPYGEQYLGAILNRHFEVAEMAASVNLGRTATDPANAGVSNVAAGRKDLNIDRTTTVPTPPAVAELSTDPNTQQQDQTQPSSTPPVPLVGQELHKKRMNDWRAARQRQHQKPDAAGFVP